IIWLPNLENGQQIWRPTNEQQVWSRGGELGLNVKHLTKVNTLEWNVDYQYSRATNQVGEHEGKVLIYTPSHQGTAMIRWTHRQKWSVQYQHTITGKRFTNRNNSDALPAFSLGSIDLSYRWNLPKLDLTNQIRINNLWSQDYQVIAWRAQAPRWIEWRLNLTFKQIKKHETLSHFTP
ncbi:MAG: hypothetical protein AAF598_20100, partial [Bacteroidota bacterium]